MIKIAVALAAATVNIRAQQNHRPELPERSRSTSGPANSAPISATHRRGYHPGAKTTSDLVRASWNART